MANKNVSGNSEMFDAFWEASSFNRYNIKEFAVAQEKYSAKVRMEPILEYPFKPRSLPIPKTLTNYLGKRRKSERTFSKKPLSRREFSTLLSSFYAYNGIEHRAYPSAGASYAVEIFCVANNVTGYNGKVLYYNSDLHAVSIIGKAPVWVSLSDKVNVQTVGTPQCIIVFVLFPNRLTSKYLERGGRFGLIEVGAAIQQLANQIAGSSKLKGVAAGGLLDDFWLRTLGLDAKEAKIVLGYLCGK